MKFKTFLIGLVMLTLISCSVPVDTAPPPTQLVFTPTLSIVEVPSPTLTSTSNGSLISTPTETQMPNIPAPFCDDPRPRELIDSFRRAIESKDGALLASLVSPSVGMDVRFYRDGNIVNYDAEHAKFVFETTFQADWGLSFGSGEPTLGSFQEIILPSLQVVFTPTAELVCNQIKVGGATYQALWPYQGMNYYSVYFPGTDQYSGMDWQTWAVGMEVITGKLYLSALVHFVWEP
jgi:hypothetical protein